MASPSGRSSPTLSEIMAQQRHEGTTAPPNNVLGPNILERLPVLRELRNNNGNNEASGASAASAARAANAANEMEPLELDNIYTLLNRNETDLNTKNDLARIFVKHNQTGPHVTKKSIIKRWKEQVVNPIFNTLFMYFNVRPELQFGFVKEPSVKNNDIFIEIQFYQLVGRDLIPHVFHMTFHIDKLSSAVVGKTSGAFHFVYETRGKRYESEKLYRFMPYLIKQNENYYITVHPIELRSIPGFNRITIRGKTLMERINDIITIIVASFNYNLNPRADTELHGLINDYNEQIKSIEEHFQRRRDEEAALFAGFKAQHELDKAAKAAANAEAKAAANAAAAAAAAAPVLPVISKTAARKARKASKLAGNSTTTGGKRYTRKLKKF